MDGVHQTSAAWTRQSIIQVHAALVFRKSTCCDIEQKGSKTQIIAARNAAVYARSARDLMSHSLLTCDDLGSSMYGSTSGSATEHAESHKIPGRNIACRMGNKFQCTSTTAAVKQRSSPATLRGTIFCQCVCDLNLQKTFQLIHRSGCRKR